MKLIAGEDHETEYEYEGSDNEEEDESTMPGEPRWAMLNILFHNPFFANAQVSNTMVLIN